MEELKTEIEKLNENFEIAKTAAETTPEVKFKQLENPVIYAFTVKEINDANNVYAVKVGDTSRLLSQRLGEWRKQYPTLKEITSINAYIEIENKTTNHTERLYFRDHFLHSWLEQKGYIPLTHSTKKKTLENLSGKQIINPFGTGKISQEFYVNNGINENNLNIKNIIDITKGIDDEVFKEFIKYVKANPEVLKESFSSSHKNEDVINYRAKAAVDYDPFPYQSFAVKELVKKIVLKNKNNIDPSDIKVLLNSGTGSGKSNMLMWAVKAIYTQEQNRNISIKKLYKKVFSPVKSGKIENKRTLTIATTALPDVLLELQKTIESHADFRDNYYYFSAQEVKDTNGKCIEDAYEGRLKDDAGNELHPFNNVVVGISLQNISGRKESGELKEVHKILSRYEIDLVIGDEAHFAMFSGDVYKKAIKDNKETSNDEKSEMLKDLREYTNNKESYSFNPRLGFLFATATSEKLLLENVFNLDTDVVYIAPETIDMQAKLENERYINDPNLNEADSPFFGRPVMNYFAIKIAEEINKLFEVDDKTGNFVNKQAEGILDALFTDRIVESEGNIDNFVPRLLSSETFKKAGVGQHILISVSQKKVADAVERYLESIQSEIVNTDGKRLHILNVSSRNANKRFTKMRAAGIKRFIYDNRFDRTVTITVDRLGVGVSVDQWDTIILARGGNSISKRQQLYGRVSRTWNETIDNGNEKIKYCLKPNSFVIDFRSEMVYEIENRQEVNTEVLKNKNSNNGIVENDEFLNDENEPQPFKRILTIDNGNLRELSRLDVHAQLEAALERSTVGDLVSRVPKWTVDVKEELLNNTEIFKNGKPAVTLKLAEEKEGGLEVDIDLTNFNNNESDETNENGEINETVEIPEGYIMEDEAEESKKAKELEDQKKALEKQINGSLLAAGVLLNTYNFNINSFNELYEFLYKDPDIFNTNKNAENFNINEFKKEVGLKPEYDFNIKKIYEKDRLVNYSLSTSLKALNVLANEDDLGFIKVINGLSRISNNEILTPVEPINVPELVISKIDLSK